MAEAVGAWMWMSARPCGCLPRLAHTNPECCPVTLRFHNRQMECAFAAQRAVSLRHHGVVLMKMAIVAYICQGSVQTLLSKWHARETFVSDEAYQAHLVILYSNGISALVSFAVWAALRCDRLMNRIPAMGVEVLFMVLLVLLLYVAVLCSPVSVAQIQGKEWKEVFGADYFASDSRNLLLIDAIVTAAHLGLPVRWFIMLPMEIASVILYMVLAFVFGSAEPLPAVMGNISLLLTVVVLSALGKRATEIVERTHFCDIIAEKSLRCEAEFRLAQVDSREASPESDGQDAVSERRPQSTGELTDATAQSGKVFDPIYLKGSDIAQQLTQVAKMGESEHWLIHQDTLTVLKDDVLGEGGFGRVFLGIFAGLMVAVKVPHKNLSETKPSKLAALCNELRVLRRLRHPNIVTIHGAVVDPTTHQINLVLELIRGYTVHEFLIGAPQERRSFECSSLARFQVMLGVCRALHYMHSFRPPVVHGDIKSSNIIVEFDGCNAHAKLLDFGLSRVLTSNVRPLGGTLAWVAPEVVQKSGPVKCSADIYSVGRMIAFVATGIPPLSNKTPKQVKRSLQSGQTLLPHWPCGCVFQAGLRPLVESCLRSEENERPSIAEVQGVLVRLPRELPLGEPSTTFLKDVRKLAAHWMERPARQRTEPAVTEPAVAGAGGVDNAVELSESSRANPPEGRGQPSAPAVAPAPTGSRGRQQLAVRLLEKAGPTAPTAPLVIGGAVARTRWRPVQRYRKTCTDSMESTLLDTMAGWNYELSSPACCECHGAARMAMNICAALLERPCTRQMRRSPGQCPECGILGVQLRDDGQCRVCGDEPRLGDDEVHQRMSL